MITKFDLILKISRKMAAGLRLVVTGLVIGFYSYMAIAVLAQVVGRYVFNYSIGWAAETATFAQIWMVLLAAGIAMRKNLHVGVDVLTNVLPTQAVRLLTLVIMVSCLWFLWQAVIGSFALIEIGQIQSSPALQIPMWIPYLSLPIGLTYFAFELILALFGKWKDPRGEMKRLEEMQA